MSISDNEQQFLPRRLARPLSAALAAPGCPTTGILAADAPRSCVRKTQINPACKGGRYARENSTLLVFQRENGPHLFRCPPNGAPTGWLSPCERRARAAPSVAGDSCARSAGHRLEA